MTENSLGLPNTLTSEAKTESQIQEQVNSSASAAETPEQIAERERIEAEKKSAEIITPDKIFGDEYKEKKWEDIKTEFNSRGEKLTAHEKKIQELESRKPAFADPEVEEYNSWVSNGGAKDYGLFSKVKSIDNNTIDGIDAVVTKTILENPAFKGMEDQIKQELIDQYQLESTEEKPLDEKQIAFNKAKFETKVKEAKEYLTGLKGKLKVADTDPEAPKKLYEKRVAEWTPVATKAISELKAVSIPILKKDESGKVLKDEKGNDLFDIFGDYPIPEHVAKRQFERTMQVLSSSDVNDNTAKQIPAYLQREIILENLPYLISHVQEVTRKSVADEYDKKYGGTVLRTPGAKIVTEKSDPDLSKKLANL